MTRRDNTAAILPLQLTISIFCISALCLFTSLSQAGAFLANMAVDDHQKYILYGAAFGLLAGSQLLARLVGHAITHEVPGWIPALCFVCVLALESFSVATSMAALNSTMLGAERSQNFSSPEYREIQKNIRHYDDLIASLNNQAQALPASYVTKRQQILEKISIQQNKKERQQRMAQQLNVSVTAKTFDNIEATIGLSQSMISLLGAIMLSMVPLSLAIAAGALGARRLLGKKK